VRAVEASIEGDSSVIAERYTAWRSTTT